MAKLYAAIDAVRRSHWTSSYGEMPSVEKRRENVNPLCADAPGERGASAPCSENRCRNQGVVAPDPPWFRRATAAPRAWHRPTWV